jgi:hypothetical protein
VEGEIKNRENVLDERLDTLEGVVRDPVLIIQVANLTVDVKEVQATMDMALVDIKVLATFADVKNMEPGTIGTLEAEVVDLKNLLASQQARTGQLISTCMGKTVTNLLLKGIRAGSDPEEGQDPLIETENTQGEGEALGQDSVEDSVEVVEETIEGELDVVDALSRYADEVEYIDGGGEEGPDGAWK